MIRLRETRTFRCRVSTIRPFLHRGRFVLVAVLGTAMALTVPTLLYAQGSAAASSSTLPDAPIPQTPDGTVSQVPTSQKPQDDKDKKKLEWEQAERELHEEEQQHVLGVVPYFNVVNGGNATPLNPKQKFELALKGSINPVPFVLAGIVAGISQAENSYPGYGQGVEGYGKRFGAQYADTFDGKMFGKVLFPIVFHQDPRYYRLGTGSFQKRFWYSVSSIARTKGDNGNWQPNYSSILGNFTAGGMSNLYYPASQRGVALTFERGSVITAEGMLGGLLNELFPDIQHRFAHKKTTCTN